MSLGSRVAALEREVADLRATVARLAAQLEEPEPSSFDLVAPGPSSAVSPPRQAVTSSSSAGRSQAAFTAPPRASVSSSAPVAANSSLSASSRGAACREIGLFLRRCLSGEDRGASGRDRLPGGSRFWVVARDYHGVDLSPVQVYTRFGDCKHLVKIGSDLGASVIAVCSAADLDLPGQW